ncbi:hypothetical protein [Paracoccus sp. (in: a-proteobacteria)]|uniref:hypothetical protein n=1 Tax=Paracoccus sp. TaxID=267 RepID=UPI003A8C4CAA
MLLTFGLTSANVDADIFNLWIARDLVPKLPPGAVVVMDNATFHTQSDTRIMIESAGHTGASRPRPATVMRNSPRTARSWSATSLSQPS